MDRQSESSGVKQHKRRYIQLQSAVWLLVLYCCFSLLPLRSAARSETSLGQQWREIVETFADEHRDQTGAAAVSLFSAGGDHYSGFFGHEDHDRKKPATAETVFEWGSITKILVWVSVLQLEGKGKLDLDTDIRQYLPAGFLQNLSFNEPVTLRHCMNHTTGFQEILADIFLPEDEEIPPLQELMRRIQPRQVYRPDTVTAYSNWGAALAAVAVEQVSGRDFADYVIEHIFTPLQMRMTAIRPHQEDNEQVRMASQRINEFAADGQPLSEPRYAVALYPAGSAVSTLADLGTFAEALLVNDERLELSRAIYAEATDDYADIDTKRNYHGLWLLPFGRPVLGHGGNTNGQSAYLLLDPWQRQGMVVMTNTKRESHFTKQLPARVFGGFDEQTYFSFDRTLPQGFYHSARVVRRGPFRLTDLHYLRFEDEKKERASFWTVAADGRVEYPYDDLLPVSSATVWGRRGLLALWVVSGASTILQWPLMAVVSVWRRRRSRQKERQLGGRQCVWHFSGTVLVLLSGLGLWWLMRLVTAYRSYSEYRWVFAAYLAEAVILIGHICWGLRQRRKLSVYVQAVAEAVVVANILYWQLYCFWLL